MLTAALFIIAEVWKHTKYPTSIDKEDGYIQTDQEQMYKEDMIYTHTLEYYSVL